MRYEKLAMAALLLAAGIPLTFSTQVKALPPGQGPGYDRGGWDAPPPELQDVQRLGFHDGIVGAQKDFDNHRNPDPNNRDEYRHPSLPRYEWDAYRDGFRRGYQRGVDHLMGAQPQPTGGPYPGPGPAGPPQSPEWNRPAPPPTPGPGAQIHIQGFQDGMVGALKDLDNHRRPDPDNRDEYRHPAVPFELQGAYRDGFRDGYGRCMAILTAGPDRDDRFAGPGLDMRRRGFREGAEGAIRDFENHRPPDPNNRDEYRNPGFIPFELRDAYRDGFQHGYERAAAELSGYASRDWR